MFVFDFHHAGQECRVMDISCAAENLTQACRAWQEGCELFCIEVGFCREATECVLSRLFLIKSLSLKVVRSWIVLFVMSSLYNLILFHS